MVDNEKVLKEYLETNAIKMDQTKKHSDVNKEFLDPNVRRIKAELAKNGAKALGLESKQNNDRIKKDIAEIIGKKEEHVKTNKESQDKPKTAEGRQKEEQEYLDKLIKLHEEKMAMYKNQRKVQKIIPTERELILMITLQKEINKGKSKYESEYGAEEANKLFNKNFKEEALEEKLILEQHQNKIEKLEELNKGLDEKLGQIEVLEYQMEKGQISIEDYQMEKESLQNEKLNILWDINEMNPSILAQEEKELKENEQYIENELGSNFDKNQREDLTRKNVNISKGIDQTKENQKGEINNAKVDIEERQEQAITNKELTINELEIKLANTRDEDKIILITNEITKLKVDEENSKAQKEMTTGEKEVGYTEMENATTIKGNFAEEIDDTTAELKEVMEKQDQLEKEINPEIKREENPLIRDMQEKVKYITDLDSAKECLESMRKITEEAKEYNKELEDVKNESNIK